MKRWLRGKKTYIIGVGAILTAVGGYTGEQINFPELIATILAALGGMSLRAGISNG